MHKIVYIDEDEHKRNQFKLRLGDDIDDTGIAFDVVLINPPAGVEEALGLVAEHPDVAALICDYDLREKSSKPNYFGTDIVQMFLAERPEFPCFLLTSYASRAVEEAKQPYRVIPRTRIFQKGEKDENSEPSFQRILQRSIEAYSSQLDAWLAECNALLAKQADQGLTMAEEQRLIDLDRNLERSVNAPLSLPDQVKKSVEVSRWSKILDDVEEAISKAKEN